MKTPAGLHGVAHGLLLHRTVAVMNHLLGGGVLGASLGTLGHGVLGLRAGLPCPVLDIGPDSRCGQEFISRCLFWHRDMNS